jgi:hypothetical protein
MPYELRQVNRGWKVCKVEEEKCFSKKPLSKETATKQRIAILLSERQRAAARARTKVK